MQGKAEEPEEKQESKKKKRDVEDLPYCTTAHSAEHMRAHEEDEPCDDSRAGK